MWGLLSSLITDSTASFISAEVFLRAYPGPRSVVLYRTILRNLLTKAHNVILDPILWLAFRVPVGWTVLLFFPGSKAGVRP